MKGRLLFFLFFVLIWTKGWGQVTVNVDLSGKADTSVTISSNRNGSYCGDSTCVVFVVTLNPGSDLLDISSGQLAASDFYTVNCGPQTPVGTPVCVNGLTTANIAFCKPGNNVISYTITASTAVKASNDITLRQGCTGSMSVTGLDAATVTWTSIYPGANGDYDSYLSCPSGCATTNVTPAIGAPPYIDYKVNGNITSCSAFKTDTVRVYTVTAMTVSVSPTNASICAGTSGNIILTATPAGGNTPYTYLWSTGETTPSITVTSPNTYTVSVTDNTSGCGPVTQNVTVATAPIPAAPTASGTTICSGSAGTVTATAPGGTYQWFDAASGGNLLSTGASYTTPALTATTTYYVETNVNGCTSARTAVTVTVNPIPAAPTASGTTICSGSAGTITATAPGGTYQWFDAASGGNLLSTGASYTTPALTATTTYYVETNVNGCTSARTAVTVTVNPIPAAPTASGTTICSGSAGTITATAPGGTYQWFDAASGGNLLSTGASYTTPALTATTTYYVETNVNGCTSARTAVTVTVNPIPAAPTASGTTICSGSAGTVTATAPGGTYQWFDAASGGNLLSTGASYTTPALTATTTYYVETNVNGCTSARTAVTVTVNPIPAAPTASGTTICSGSAGTVTATAPGGTYQWFDAASGGNLLSTGASYTTPALTATTTYYVETNVNGCTSARTAVTVTVNPIPAAPTASGTTICSGSAATVAATAPGGTYQWFDAASGGNLLSTGASYTTPALTATTTYYVETNVNGCTSARTAVTVTVNPIPAAPTASGTTICSGSAGTVTATAPGGTYQWFDAASGGNLLSTGASYTTPALTATTTYYVETNVNGCTSARTAVTVTVNPIPAINSASAGTICNSTAQNYVITSNVSGTTFNWSRAAVSGISNGAVSNQISNPITETLNNTTSVPIDVNYTIIPIANGCIGNVFTYTVTVNPTPHITSASSAIICNNTSQNYTITSNVSGVNFIWSRAAVAGISNAAVSSQTSNIITEALNNSSSAPVSVTYNIVPFVNGCQGPPFNYTVTVQPTATITNSPLTQIVCSQSSTASVIVQSNVSGATFQWTATATPGITGFTANGTGNIPSQVLLNADTVPGTVTYTITPYYNGCTGTPANYVVTVNPKPATPLAGSNSPVCQNSVLSLTTPVVNGASYSWIGPNGFTSSLQNPVIASAGLSASGTYTLFITVNGCTSDGGTTNVTVIPTPLAPVAANNGPLCQGTTLVLTASNITGATYSWTGPNGFASNLQNPLINNVTAANAGTYTVTATVNGCTSPAGSTTVVVNALPAAPVATSNSPVCQGSPISLSVQALPGYTYTWTGPNNFSSTQANPTIAIANQANAGTYYVTATSATCTGPPQAVTVAVNETPVNPVASSNSPVCTGYPITLSASTFIGAIYQWTGPNGFTSNQQNPVINNAATVNAGVYTVSITAPGCSTTTNASTLVVINQTPIAPTASSNSPVCIASDIKLSAADVAGATYLWSGPNGFTSTLQNPVIRNAALTDSGTYKVVVTVNTCTSAATQIKVIVSKPETAFAGTDQVTCANSPNVTLAGSITGDNSNGIWTTSGSGIFLQGDTSLNGIYVPSSADIAAGGVLLTLSSTQNGGCSVSSSSFKVTINPTPIISAGGNQSMCASDPSINISGSATYASGAEWTTSGSGYFSPSNTAINMSYTPSDADKMSGAVKLTLTSTGNNCLPVSDTMTLSIVPSPIVSLPNVIYIKQGDSKVLEPVITGSAVQYLWTPNLYLSSATVNKPIITGVESKLYTLTAIGASGCIGSGQVQVNVLKPIIVPNTFTPNGDGINDVWVIKELANYPGNEVIIFNRYGTKLYSSRGYAVPWDGTYGGKSVPFGTYYYIINMGIYGVPVAGYVTVVR